jgi:ABC-type dipeptide/oligopeptide/nickel transport system permease subunit
VLSTLRFGAALLAGSGLSFIGLGAQPPTPEWGAIMASGREYLLDAWWITFFPGALIALSVLGVNLVGDGLRDRLDPTLRGFETGGGRSVARR